MSYPFQVMDGPQKILRPCWGLQVLRISRMPTRQRIALRLPLLPAVRRRPSEGR